MNSFSWQKSDFFFSMEKKMTEKENTPSWLVIEISDSAYFNSFGFFCLYVNAWYVNELVTESTVLQCEYLLQFTVSDC